jgi:hypothetical protein
MTKIRQILIALFIICLIDTQSLAQSNFYKKYFQNDDFNFKNNDNLVISSTEFEDYKTKLSNYNKVFIICNSNFIYKNYGECNPADIKSVSSLNNITVIQKSNEIFSLFKIQDGYSTVFLIPEINFINPTKLEILRTYLQAIRNSDLTNISEIEDSKNFKNTLFSLVSSWIFEIFYLTIIGILFVGLSYKSFKMVIDSPSIISKKLWADIYLKSLNFFKEHSLVFLLIILLISLFSVVSIDYFYYPETRTFTKGLFLKTINPFTVQYLYNASDSRPLYLFVIFHTFLILMINFLSPFYLNFIKESFSKLKNSKFKLKNVAYIYIFNVLAIVFLTIKSVNNESLGLISLNFVCALLTGLYLNYKKFDFVSSFTHIEKLIISLTVVSFFAISIYCSNNFCKYYVKNLYREDRLIGVNNMLVMLPYIKSTTEDVLIAEFKPDTDRSIFIEEYLLSFAKYKSIVYRPIPELDLNTSGVIASKNLKDLSELIFKNIELRNIITTKDLSKFFYLTQNSEFKEDLKIEIEYYCSAGVFKNYIKLEGEQLMAMAPCSSKNIETNKILFNVDQNTFHFKEGRVYEFDNYENVKAIKFLNSEGKEPYTINFLNIKKEQLYFIYLNEGKTETITNYILKTEIDSKLNGFKSKSDFINYLKLNKIIGNNFMIWSMDKYVIIKNDYKKN